MAKYEFIDSYAAAPKAPAVLMMCRWLEVSRSGFYHWRSRAVSATAARRAALAVRVQHFFKESDGTYGYRRIHADLAGGGVECSPELVRQIMARRHTPEQVIAKVRQGQKMLNDGRPMVEVIKELQVTEATWYRWLNQYGSEKNAEASKRTKELEKENARLKRLLAEKELAIDILNEVAKGKF